MGLLHGAAAFTHNSEKSTTPSEGQCSEYLKVGNRSD